MRVDGAGSTHKYLAWLTGQRLFYSVGFSLPDNTPQLLAKIPQHVWAPALDAHDEVRASAWDADLTGLLNLTNWLAGMRVIVRKEPKKCMRLSMILRTLTLSLCGRRRGA